MAGLTCPAWDSLDTSLSVLLRLDRMVLILMLEALLRFPLLSVFRLDDLLTFSLSNGNVL